jgi:hypothetical protein
MKKLLKLQSVIGESKFTYSNQVIQMLFEIIIEYKNLPALRDLNIPLLSDNGEITKIKDS